MPDAYDTIFPRNYWGRSAIKVFNGDGTHLASVPTRFLAASKSNTWAWVTEAVERICGIEFDCAPGYVDDKTRAEVELGTPPYEGSFTLAWTTGTTPPTTAFLPLPPHTAYLAMVAAQRRFVAPGPGSPGSESGRSDESGVSGETSYSAHFYSSTVAANAGGKCLITGGDENLHATPLVPQALGEDRLGHIAGEDSLSEYHPSLGISLDCSLSQYYLSLRLAFLPLRKAALFSDNGAAAAAQASSTTEAWVVHFFIPPGEPEDPGSIAAAIYAAYASCHGQVITIRGKESLRPSWRFASYHYTQCLRMRFGGTLPNRATVPQKRQSEGTP
ncbi:uncharacterized protein LOC62_03G005010 [Vanrija pseudolonga]|uniref:Uncharacterized protein n=1 Tax=Vanrija pseudolonga TaxID=143232 RepID=A0AAF0YDG8_9TREE|nr:hypothetical protein LOC62_03G005010 [Vanrija pseudolonga]